jgi:hypothetical protein
MTRTKKITPAVRTASFLGVVALFTVLTMPSAFGQDNIKAKIPFPFQIGTKTLPAGEYQFGIESSTVAVVGSSKGNSAEALIITRLAATPHSDATHAHIVFDKVGTTYTLSELWSPGEEGILVHATKGKHEHHVLHATP